ncbi:hypothetical protein PPYR_04170 [Photinus pyralis]|uniref:Methyltransferase-like protein 5 n=1 Tax=Photinus pyralis TaxID=7054 RepID=A0A1Y1ML99_PHOPY|nr:methyltransferase-like protein 5 [Photinus pyralis]KAB0801984.1 hypothetical protein PPYR_04170 [Photinus pyralis]
MWPCMKLRHLEELLQQIDGFDNPKLLLEQYVTPSHLASHMLHTIQAHYGDIDSKLIADLGSGCGGLTLGTAALNAGLVIGFEIDANAIQICQNNINDQEFSNIDIVQCDITSNSFVSRWFKMFDTVIMNPPFGTKHNAGIDMDFLKKGFALSNNVIYSLHKSSTRAHVLKFAKANDVKAEVLAQLRYDLPTTYKFHKKDSVDIEVDFFRFQVSKNP